VCDRLTDIASLVQVADEAGLELRQNLDSADATAVPELQKPVPKEVEEDALAQRLRALRPAT
jgi:division protein CdvB (Snf7/Vps24/ESCRT-III family)